MHATNLVSSLRYESTKELVGPRIKGGRVWEGTLGGRLVGCPGLNREGFCENVGSIRVVISLQHGFGKLVTEAQGLHMEIGCHGVRIPSPQQTCPH